MEKSICKICNIEIHNNTNYLYVREILFVLCVECFGPLKKILDGLHETRNIIIENFIQPERSKREDTNK